MVAVFVHGVPETSAIWSPLIAALRQDDAVALQLPGFGCATPDGFGASMHDYATWLGDELAAIDAPVDLVTHDWGAFLAVRVLADRPANVRSWVTDGGYVDADFQWHDLARLWQTPGDGEAFMDGFVGGSVDDRAAMLLGSGVPESAATDLAAPIDRTMADAILPLYRSATEIGREWGTCVDSISVPTLIIEALVDAFRSEENTDRMASKLGADRAQLADQGHWWMLGDPAGAAAAIEPFWGALAN
ncbi:MAG: alpha/beta fold hydrolase [Acidimicrobiales bacterium]